MTTDASGTYSKFEYCSSGTGIRVYVVDTGILPNHKEFRNATGGSRVDTASYNHLVSHLQTKAAATGNPDLTLNDQCFVSLGSGWDNAANMHGTGVASLVGGVDYGSAKNVTLVDARAYRCNEINTQTQTARVLAVLEWIPTDPNRGPNTAVVNISSSWSRLASSSSSAVNYAVDALVNTHRCVVTVAAGNNNESTAWQIPASAGRAITVGGTSKMSDTTWQTTVQLSNGTIIGSNYSQYGSRMHVYAPAQFVQSASTRVTEVIPLLGYDRLRSEAPDCNYIHPDPDGRPMYPDTCTSGTSFAAPLVAGTIARYLQWNPSGTRDQALAYLLNEQAQHSGVAIYEPETAVSYPILNVSDCP